MVKLLDEVTLKDGRKVTVVEFDRDENGLSMKVVADQKYWNIETNKTGRQSFWVRESEITNIT